jgi:lysylphosphatidylglycerol synthetase-like protein (DUF2156 family)
MRKRIVRGLIVTACVLLLTTAVLVNMGALRYGFVNSVNAGWFGFVLARIVELFLVVLAVRRLWRWSRAIGASVAAVLILGLTIFSVTASYSPAGIYSDVDEYGRDEDHYFLFADGKVDDIHKDTRGQWGRYEKTADGWIFTQQSNGQPLVWRLKFSVFGIYMYTTENPEPRLFLPRRIIPLLRPRWMPNWLQ